MVKFAPELTPKQLLVGAQTRPALGQLHSALANIDRVKYYRSKIVERPDSSMAGLYTYERDCVERIFPFISVLGFVIQTNFMRERLKARESALQSDSIEKLHIIGASRDAYRNATITMTTGHCPLLQRNIPVLISLLYGKSADHYAFHFDSLFQSMQMPRNLDEWGDTFPGNTCDFSDAERAGFETALREYCSIPDDVDVHMERYYRFCEVHFKRTLSRVTNNHALVPSSEQKACYKNLVSLLKQTDPESFADRVEGIVRKYPKLKAWLDWHLHESRGKHIFPALGSSEMAFMSRDTNAQESVGGSWERSAPSLKMTIGQTIGHTHRFVKEIEAAYNNALVGIRDKYKPRKARNDGRPPDTIPRIRSATKRKRRQQEAATERVIKKIRGSRCEDRLTPVGTDVNWATFGIPWSFTYGDVTYTNTSIRL
ncbi:Uncharacterized protein PBTT_02017 [Plasmodiophora brassicae]